MPDVNPDPRLPLARSSRGLLREDVYRHLRDAIIDGQYQPGERLRDADLASELGVSRTPVREALRRLEDEGLIETWANRWTRVAAIDVGEAERVYPIIWTLERLALSQAGGLPEAALDELRAANDRVREGLRAHDAVKASEADRDFHQLIIDAAGNPEITRITDELKLRLRRLEVHYFGGSVLAEASSAEHQAVIDALAAGDRDAAGAAIEKNWRQSLERVRNQVA
jgi:DNA-binding GntR family transcriptional regulator